MSQKASKLYLLVVSFGKTNDTAKQLLDYFSYDISVIYEVTSLHEALPLDVYITQLVYEYGRIIDILPYSRYP